MSTITHVAGEAGKWVFALVVVLVALALIAVVALFVGALVWALPGALWAERVWFLAAAAGFALLLVWASIRG